MWDIQFDPSMLTQGVIIHCPSEELAKELRELLLNYGVDADNLLELWINHKKDTCFRICDDGHIKFGRRGYYETEAFSYSRNNIFCTFYGENVSDFEAATDNELMGFLGIGGG